MKPNQIGKFTIHSKFIREEPDIVARAFSLINLVPVRAEYLFVNDVIEYIALSDKFREIEQGTMPPEYEIIITDDGNFLVEIIEKNKE